MKDFFAGLYEWWGTNPFFARDLGDHLRGFDLVCEDYVGTPLYTYIGLGMIFTTFLSFLIQYYFIDSNRYSGRGHWLITSAILMIINFSIAFVLPFNDLQNTNYCSELNFSMADCLGFGFSNAIWSFILFLIITSLPFLRSRSINCRYTSIWKP
jgi:uncharacterized membrane protein YcgQ (UPF0703/DUF1980 family)